MNRAQETSLALMTLIPALVLGQAGSLPGFLLPFINFGVFVMVGIVYFAAVPVQYGRTSKETNHE